MSNPDIYTINLQGYREAQYVLLSDYERLKAEVDALMTNIPTSRLLRASRAENERLRKAGTEMGKHLPDTDEANRAYTAFESGGSL